DGPARRGRVDARPAKPCGGVRGDLLLVDARSPDAVGVALEVERTVGDVRQERVGDALVVVEQVALRDPVVGEERLVDVRRAPGGQGSEPSPSVPASRDAWAATRLRVNSSRTP